MLVSDYIFTKLKNEGIKEVFQVYGAATGHLIDSFTRVDGISYVALLHEQACGFAAEGYSKVSDNFGVAMATSGPGGQNMITCAANCFYDSVPCLFITGQINQKFLRPDKSIRQIGFQESDQVGCFKPVTKYSVMITNPDNVKYELEKAIHIMKNGRPGPVHLDIPIDVAGSEVDIDNLIGYDENLEKTFNIDKIKIQSNKLIDDLINSERPVILVGGGVKLSKSTKELLELLNFLQIPSYPTWNAIDVITSDLEYYGGKVGTYGGEGRNFGIQNSDLLISIGSRVSGRITGGDVKTFARNSKKYIIDIDEHSLQKKLQQVHFDECILSDVKLFISIFYQELVKRNFNKKYTNWLNKCIDWRNKYDTINDDMYRLGEYTNPYIFIRLLSEEMNNNDIIVADCGGNVVITNHAFKTKKGQKYFTNNGNSPMGFSFAASIGAWFASDKKQNIVCIIGDGGMNMNIQELQSLLNYNINIKIIILNNHIYGITKAFQETNFQGRVEACGPKGYSPPDFIKISEAYGVKTMRIKGTNYDSIRLKIKELLLENQSIVVDVDCHDFHDYNPKVIGWKTPIEDMYPYLDREEFMSNMLIKPMEISIDFENLVKPVKSHE